MGSIGGNMRNEVVSWLEPNQYRLVDVIAGFYRLQDDVTIADEHDIMGDIAYEALFIVLQWQRKQRESAEALAAAWEDSVRQLVHAFSAWSEGTERESKTPIPRRCCTQTFMLIGFKRKEIEMWEAVST